MLAIRGNKLFHATNLGPMRSLRQDRFGDGPERTSAMVTCLGLAMLYRHGYCSCREEFPSHLSSRKCTCDLSFIMKDPKWKKSRFTFIRLDKKCESPFFHSTCINGFDPKYLLRSTCCQVPSMVSNLNNHLLSRAIFLICRSWIPRPPWSLG